jgi:hypothetical protein
MSPVAKKLVMLTLLTLALVSSNAIAAPAARNLTIVMDFQGAHDSSTIAQMEKEFAGIMDGTGLKVDWRFREDVNNVSFDNLVVVRFKGKCIFEPLSYLYDERGPLAYTHTSEGDVLPFSEVACDHVTSAMRSAMFGGDYNHANALLGRALARVVAHEVIHILTRSGAHGHDGIAKSAFTGMQLIEKRLALLPDDLKRLQLAERLN